MKKTIYEVPSTEIIQLGLEEGITTTSQVSNAPEKMNTHSSDEWGSWE